MTSSSSRPSAPSPERRGLLAFVVAAVLIGAGAGVVGSSLLCVVRLAQHLAYGYDIGHLFEARSFLEGAASAPWWRRVAALAFCGFVAGVGWPLLARVARPLVSVEQAVRNGKPMPAVSTVVHGLLQATTVGLGSPLGREVAPREVSALYAQWLVGRAAFSPEQRRVLVACGAGAGLAAVYDVPFGGAVFTLEVLLAWKVDPPVVAAALLSSVIAALPVKVLLHDAPVYDLSGFHVGAPLLVWSALAGAVVGASAIAFRRFTSVARARAAHGRAATAACLAMFFTIGAVAIRYPQMLGNGRSAAELGLSGDLTVGLAAVLLVARSLAPIGALRAGAKGGLLTPSIAVGALLGTLLGAAWSVALPGTALSAYALIGAAAFLAVSQRMPLTAIVALAEFARVDHAMVFPMLLAVAIAVAVDSRLAGKTEARPE